MLQPVFWSDNKKELFDMIKEKPVVVDDPILSPEAKDLITKVGPPLSLLA